MKKLLIALLLVLSCALLFACVQNDPTGDTTAPSEEKTDNTTGGATDAPTNTPTEAPTEPDADVSEPATEAPTEAPEPSPVKLYQLAPEKNSLMQSYVIKTANGKLIVIDGGIDGEGRDRDPYMPAALRAIMGLGEGEYFEVEAWFLSHGHKDHMYELSKMLRDYSAESNYKINNIYFDFPEFGSEEYPTENADMEFAQIKENINKYGEVIGATVKDGSTYYDDINGAVINAESVAKGLSFEIDGVKIDVLQTWSIEDGTSNLNDTSLVLRFHIGEQSVLFLNDLGSIGGRRLLATYGDQLKSDIVQMAHHGQAGVNKDVYDAIDADVHLWPTPIWVWKNDSKIYQIDEVRAWLYGETFLEASEYDIVSCLYDKYPSASTVTRTWGRVIDGMKIEFPYIVPERPEPETEPETEPEVIEPVEHDYVSEGLVSYYSGSQSTRKGHDKDSTVWEDLVGGHDMTITKNDDNYFSDTGLRAKGAKHNFPDAIVDTVNGQAFTIEILLGDFVSVGTDFNTFINGSGDEIALFRRNSVDELELKFQINAGVRIKVKGCLELLQNSLITITYAQNDVVRIYVNGELRGETPTINGSLGASDLFIGHNAQGKMFDTTYRSVRFYDRALTAEEVAANAKVDGYGATDGE
ncbi:MAG: hypothetical protein IJW00_04950 [Clostridia bacterium]|nr:hypothetical protein [Clostridia bacterium]